MDYSSVKDHILFKKLAENEGFEVDKTLSLLTTDGHCLLAWNGFRGCIESANLKKMARDSESEDLESLYPNPRLLFNVEKIVVNGSGSLLALCGGTGACILQLRPRHGVELPCIQLKNHRKVRAAKWHPGSPLDAHLLVLSADECLRLYNGLTGDMIWSAYFCHHFTQMTLPTRASLGDTPIDFAFLSPAEDNVHIWPILVLWGTGDIYYGETRLREASPRLLGPLRVLPVAEDNYGVDASSLLVLKTSPPVVIVATCAGSLYHFLLLSCETPVRNDDSGKSLHAIEAIDLELGLAIGEEDDDAVSCPVRLESDPVNPSRYLCIHAAGVHSVDFPLVSELSSFLQNPSTYTKESSVEYALCTGVLGEYNPPVGFTHLDGDLFLAVLSDGKVVNVHLAQTSIQQDDDEKFVALIRDMLHEKAKPPILQLPVDSTRPSEWLEIVLKLITEYRENVLDTYVSVGKVLEDRAQKLRVSLENQRYQIELLEKEKLQLKGTAEFIAERYEELAEKQQELSQRAEEVVVKAGAGTARGEEIVKRSLRHSQKRAERLDEGIKQLQEISRPPLSVEKIHLPKTKKTLIKSHLQDITTQIQDLTKRVRQAEVVVGSLSTK